MISGKLASGKNTLRRLLPRRERRRAQESGVTLFRGLRVRLTLWYCGVLCAALLLFGVALYVGTRITLMQPIEANAQRSAQMHARQWQGNGLPHDACSPFGPQGQPGPQPHVPDYSMPEITACFDQNGTLLTNSLPSTNETSSSLPPAFLHNNLVQQALQSSTGTASNIVDAGSSTGRIYCFAQVVLNPAGNVIGVLVVGEFIKEQDAALSTLLTYLLSFGVGALLLAGLGGLFLANRALAPARLAWTNQQRFIADASHELRTPLTLMRADAEVLLRGRQRMDAEDADILEDIVVEAKHMAKITTDLLTLARLDSHAAHQEHEVVDLAALAGKVVRRVQNLAHQREIEIHQEYITNAYVIGDPVMLEQAILVLLDNAIKYNRPGGAIHVRVTTRDQRVCLEVQDSGIGITAEHLPYLGERFYRVDKARSRAAGGTGLGLAIARSIAALHNGQLSVHSQPNQGTTASLLLPEAHELRATSSSAERATRQETSGSVPDTQN